VFSSASCSHTISRAHYSLNTCLYCNIILTPITILPTRFHMTVGNSSVVAISYCREPGSTHFSSNCYCLYWLKVQKMLSLGYQTHITIVNARPNSVGDTGDNKCLLLSGSFQCHICHSALSFNKPCNQKLHRFTSGERVGQSHSLLLCHQKQCVKSAGDCGLLYCLTKKVRLLL